TPFYGSCSATATMTITVGGTTTWNGASWSNGLPDASKSVVFSGNFTAAADLNACSLSVTGSAVVNVPSGFNFTVANEVSVAGTASLTFQNNANLVQVADVANTGSITVLRNSAPIVRLDHTLWSSPVAGQNLFAFSPNTLPNRFYVYNTAAGNYTAAGLSAGSAFMPGRGYAVRAPNNFPASPAAPWTGTFKGVPNNGNVSYALSTAFEGHNLVGNPYPSAVSAASFVDDAGNMSKIDGTLYFYAHSLPMDANGQFPAGTNYATWNKTGHTLATNSAVVPNGTIQVGQGFIVKAVQAGNAVFTNAMRTGNTAGQFFRTAGAAASEAEKHRIWLDLSDGQGSILSQILVGYVAGATPGFDRGYDGAAFGNTGSSIATKIGDADYAIQARPLPFQASDAVPVAFKAAAAGNYAIALSGMDGLFSGGQDVFLKDNTAGTVHNLKSGAYAFNSPEGTFGSRFEVVYQNTLGTPDSVLASSSIVAFKKAGVLHVEAKNIEMASIKVYDVQGRLVYEKSGINASSAALPDLQVQDQVVLLQVTSPAGETAAIKVIL
ncbi:MAG TPA: hypothetical protein VFR70_08535, partial [Flavobacterium sp.]|nr:hypothetical protein [Flavobacterium sp.]